MAKNKHKKSAGKKRRARALHRAQKYGLHGDNGAVPNG